MRKVKLVLLGVGIIVLTLFLLIVFALFKSPLDFVTFSYKESPNYRWALWLKVYDARDSDLISQAKGYVAIPGATIFNFEIVKPGVGKTPTGVYLGEFKLDYVRNPALFSKIPGQNVRGGFFQDEKQVLYIQNKDYYKIIPITNETVTAKHFELSDVNDNFLFVGKDVYLNGIQIPNADATTFTYLPREGYIDEFGQSGSPWYKDKNNVYINGVIVKGADPDTFRIPQPDKNFGAFFGIDKNGVFNYSNHHFPARKTGPINILYCDQYGDGGCVATLNLPNIDSTGFEILTLSPTNGGTFKTVSGTYKDNGEKIPDPDPKSKSFRKLEIPAELCEQEQVRECSSEWAKDDQYVYSIEDGIYNRVVEGADPSTFEMIIRKDYPMSPTTAELYHNPLPDWYSSSCGKDSDQVFCRHCPESGCANIVSAMDAPTFANIANGYYKDKNAVYFHFGFSEFIKIKEIDPSSAYFNLKRDTNYFHICDKNECYDFSPMKNGTYSIKTRKPQ